MSIVSKEKFWEKIREHIAKVTTIPEKEIGQELNIEVATLANGCSVLKQYIYFDPISFIEYVEELYRAFWELLQDQCPSKEAIENCRSFTEVLNLFYSAYLNSLP